MSEYYGWLHGNKGQTHRCGSKGSGINAEVQSWHNNISMSLSQSEEGEDVLTIDYTKTGNRKLKVIIDQELKKLE